MKKYNRTGTKTIYTLNKIGIITYSYMYFHGSLIWHFEMQIALIQRRHNVRCVASRHDISERNGGGLGQVFSIQRMLRHYSTLFRRYFDIISTDDAISTLFRRYFDAISTLFKGPTTLFRHYFDVKPWKKQVDAS